MSFQLKDGACNILKLIQTSKIIKCETPYYQTYYNQCIKCTIVNCLYCFDYLKEDVTKNTIFYAMTNDGINKIYANDLQVLVGCAQCLQGYIYDFTIGQCFYQQPQIQNCLRSFVNQQGKELCILTSIDDFTVAPQMINCEHHILHCKQCFKNIQTILKCLICEIGYVASYNTGLCEIGKISDSTKYTGMFFDNNIWRYVVQSFSMQFTQINYSYQPYYYSIYDIECSDGYSLYKGKCTKYCDQNCQQCLKQDIQESFTCALCPLNNYQELNRVQENGKCIICPSLCLVCQIRSNDSIMSINPYYTINETNAQYTTQCIKSISNSNVQIDPYLQIAQYIYDPNQITIEHPVVWSCNFQSSGRNTYKFFEKNFDFSYFNEIGLQQFILTIQFDQPCSVNNENITNTIQTKVFSIQLAKLILKGDLSKLIFYQIENFNFIELSNLLVNIENNLTFEFQNNGKAIDFNISNSSFFQINQNQLNFRFQ